MKIELQIINEQDLKGISMLSLLDLLNKTKMCKNAVFPSNMNNEIKEKFIKHIDNNLDLLSKEYLNRVRKDFSNLNSN